MPRRALLLNIPERLPGLNAVNNANRRSRYAGARQKKRWTALLATHARQCKPITGGPWHWRFAWRCRDRRRDPDNVASACKLVFDGLVEAGVLENDGWHQVASIEHQFALDADEGVTVEAFERG